MASGLQDIPLRRIPEQWDRQWFAEFVRDVLRLADARNIDVSSEFDLTGQSDEVASLTMSLGGIDLDRLADQPGLSVIGNPADATGALQALVAASDLHVLRRAGVVVGFGLIDSSYISNFQEASEDVTAALIDDGTGISWAYNDLAASLVGTVTLAPFTTTNLSEGVNLYYTDARARAAITPTDTASIDFTYAAGALSAVVLPAGVNHDSLLNYVADQHVAHTGVTLTAGAGLTGGGDISANRTFTVGPGTGITVNADDVAVNVTAAFTWTNIHSWSGGGKVQLGTQAPQSTALLSARALPNGFEWGHPNTAGYLCTLGYGSSSGDPFLAFCAEHGTNANTWMTRGNVGRVIKADTLGVLTIGRIATASADNQSLTSDLTVSAAGVVNVVASLTVGGSAVLVTSTYQALTPTWAGDHTFNALVKIADGSVSAPSLCFTNDVDCGLYRIGANNIAITVGNSKVFDIGINTGTTTLNTGGFHVAQPSAATGANLYLDGRSGAVNRIRFTTDGGATTSELRLRDDTAGVDRITLTSSLLTSAVPVSITGNLTLNTAGNKISIKEGTNAAMGVATLVLGTVVVSTTVVTATSRIQLTAQSLGTITVPSALGVSARTAGTSFTILASQLTDTSVIAWEIREPA